jgi:hypothetical protein
MSSSRTSMRISQRQTRLGYTMVFVYLLDSVLRRCSTDCSYASVVGLVCWGARGTHACSLPRPRVRCYCVKWYALPSTPPSQLDAELNGTLLVPSGDACRAYELGIHGRDPARCGPKMLLKPGELDHHYRQATQIPPPARATKETVRPRRTGV